MMTNTMTNTTTILLLLLCNNNIITNTVLINAQQIITATYNPNYTAPTCLTPAMKCETVDPSWGIDGVGFYEPNSPNTIDDCVDYSNTYYGRDEYIMKLLVRNVDGNIITGGTSVRITTRINTAENTTTRAVPDDEEVVHFYYTRNVTSTPINWEYITTKTRNTGVGESTIHTSVSLDYQGGLQAVRVNLGYGIYTPQECASDGLTNGDSYVDVDDLVFYVVPGPPSVSPTSSPTNTDAPTMMPSVLTSEPSSSPSGKLTDVPSVIPTSESSNEPSIGPSAVSSQAPSSQPTSMPPSESVSEMPSEQPSWNPTIGKTSTPSSEPSVPPTSMSSIQPSSQPIDQPSSWPSSQPIEQSSSQPSSLSSSSQPSSRPSSQATLRPSSQPSITQTSNEPSSMTSYTLSIVDDTSSQPSSQPSLKPSSQTTSIPSTQPSIQTSNGPSVMDSYRPIIDDTTALPSLELSQWPSVATTDLLSSNPTIANVHSFQSSQTEEPSSTPIVAVTSVAPTIESTQTELLTMINSTEGVNGTQSPSPSSIDDDDDINVGDDNPFANDDEELLDDDDESWFEKLPFLPNSSPYTKRNNILEVGISSFVVLLSLIMI